MKCPHCGYNSVGNYCSECGARLTPPESRVMDTRSPKERGAVAADAVGPDAVGPDAVEPVISKTPKPTYAGFWVRVAAYLLDGFIIGIPVALVVLMLFDPEVVAAETWSGSDWAAMILTAGVIIFMWVNWDGRTPGKKLLGMRVVRLPGYQSLNYGHAVLRYVGYLISALLFGIGFLMIAFRQDKRGLHDLIAHTCVIYEKK